MWTNGSHEALSEDTLQGRSQQVGFHTHIQQTRYGSRSVVSMQSRKNQMAGKGTANGNVGGFAVANLTNHDDVRVLSNNGPQTIGKIQTTLAVYGDLIDAVELILNGVLNSDDLLLRSVDLIQGGIKSGGLATTGGSGDQDYAVRTL